ncbi:MAG: flagellar export protein FliJ [Spirochaetaceae bacterium]|nr:MAG: flagellar export protein FliJ [Spirochaetaceae bacterium]
MKRFEFSLGKVLRLREHRESEWELRLGEATSRCVSLQDQIASVAREHQQTVAAGGGTQAADVEFRMWQGAYLALLEQRRRRLTDLLQQAQREREEIHRQYVEALRDRKTLTSLKDRQEQAYRRDQLRYDTKVLDDLTSARSARARKPKWEATADGTL